MGRGADEPVLNKLDDRGVIHWGVRNIVLSCERRDDDVRQAEPQLCGKALNGRGITRISAWVN